LSMMNNLLEDVVDVVAAFLGRNAIALIGLSALLLAAWVR